ncbi:MAG TPA: hypothetical protein VER36_07505 [Flavisolibacter sp.]|nr:hypothetical protein [Flavisolibacter sp.]
MDNASKMLYADYTTVSTRIGGQYGRWDTRSSDTSMTAITVTNFASASVTQAAAETLGFATIMKKTQSAI